MEINKSSYTLKRGQPGEPKRQYQKSGLPKELYFICQCGSKNKIVFTSNATREWHKTLDLAQCGRCGKKRFEGVAVDKPTT